MALQKQGSFSISTKNVDPDSTIKEIKDAETDSALKKAVTNVLKTARIFSSNIPGTKSYFQSTRYEMKDINFYNAYIHDKHLSIFHTGSLAEFHEPPLWTLLAKYLSAINNDDSYAYAIMNDNKKFNLAAHKYKNIVTHHLASKMEIWFGTFFAPIFDIHNGFVINDFARNRGAIHYHGIFAASGKFLNELQNCLFLMTVTIHESMEVLKSFIAEKWREPEY